MSFNVGFTFSNFSCLKYDGIIPNSVPEKLIIIVFLSDNSLKIDKKNKRELHTLYLVIEIQIPLVLFSFNSLHSFIHCKYLYPSFCVGSNIIPSAHSFQALINKNLSSLIESM